MTTPLANATRGAFAAALCVAGELGTYTYKGQTRRTTFAPSQPRDDTFPADGNAMIDTDRIDLLVPWDGLGKGDQFLEPQRGGRVTLDSGRTFELCDPGNGHAWRWSDGQQSFLRLHARET